MFNKKIIAKMKYLQQHMSKKCTFVKAEMGLKINFSLNIKNFVIYFAFGQF